jgi:hypothetical protein
VPRRLPPHGEHASRSCESWSRRADRQASGRARPLPRRQSSWIIVERRECLARSCGDSRLR